ncbi:MAG TPA: hypothetical protein PKE47_06165 [Verrucomicrobiota bacterium]|nr:hypothetical protein [Verrucomicrobiota bacterium]
MKLNPFQRGFLAGLLAGWAPLVVLLLAILVVQRVVDPAAPRLGRAFLQLRPGMPRAEVEAVLGAPGERSDSFLLAQRAGYEWEHAAAGRLGAAYFLTWATRGLRVTVAFDAEDRAIFAARGGT